MCNWNNCVSFKFKVGKLLHLKPYYPTKHLCTLQKYSARPIYFIKLTQLSRIREFESWVRRQSLGVLRLMPLAGTVGGTTPVVGEFEEVQGWTTGS